MSEQQVAASVQVGQFVWETGGELATLRRKAVRKDGGRLIHYAVLIVLLLAWTLMLWILPGLATMFLASFVMAFPIVYAASRCIDFTKAKGRSAMRESIAIGPAAEGSYRERGLRLRVDGADVPIAPDTRLFRVTWKIPQPRGSRTEDELSLVNEGRVLVIADGILDGTPEAIDRVTELLSDAGGGILGVQRVSDAVRMGGGCSGCLAMLLFYAWILLAVLLFCVEFGALSAANARSLVAVATFAGVNGLRALSIVNLAAANTASEAPTTLQKVYGVTDPPPQPVLWRPWPAIALAVAVALGGYALAERWIPGSHPFAHTAAPAGSTRTPPLPR